MPNKTTQYSCLNNISHWEGDELFIRKFDILGYLLCIGYVDIE